MKPQENILISESRDLTVSKQRMLNQINEQLEKYSSGNIPLHECLTNAGLLSVKLIDDHYTETKLPENIYDDILTMFTNYYTILHIDNFSGNYIVNKEYIYHQVLPINDRALTEIFKMDKMKSFDLKTARRNSRKFIYQLIDTYYKSGIEGCLKYLCFSVYTLLKSTGNRSDLNKQNIEKLIRRVQAEKFLSLFHSDIKVWT